MEVTVLRATEQPERLVCQAARGDYFEGYVGDEDYWSLMKGVDFTESDVQAVQKIYDPDTPTEGSYWDAEAATRSFIRKQLSRGHYGPWEHPQITFAVKGISRVTMAQITRHRLMSFDVQSMRYANFDDVEPITPVTLLSPEERLEKYPHVFEDLEDASEYYERHSGELDVSEQNREHIRNMYDFNTLRQIERYDGMVDAGIPKEDARFILPLGTPVNMTFSGNARTFMHLMDMRKKPNAQWEIQELSGRLFDELREWMPYTFEWYDNKPHKLAP